jgi:translation initiation factor 2 subunit 3
MSSNQKHRDDSDSEAEDDHVVEQIQKIDIDPLKLTPLSPEVISKQVSTFTFFLSQI